MRPLLTILGFAFIGVGAWTPGVLGGVLIGVGVVYVVTAVVWGK